jgi:RNA polymerase sigma-70 factor (sigma-E family)
MGSMKAASGPDGNGERTTSFDAFFRQEYDRAVRLAWLLTRSSAGCEDVVQDAFAAVHARFDTLDNPGGYLRTTVLNGCRRWHRSNTREDRRLRLVSANDMASQPEVREMVDALQGLPYRQRAVLVLRYWADMTEAEIAQTLGCRPGTVKSLASRGLERLRKEVPR